MNRLREDVQQCFSGPYEIVQGYDLMVMEACISGNMLIRAADIMIEETRQNHNNTLISSFLNESIISKIEHYYEHIKGVQMHIQGSRFSTAASMHLELKLQEATSRFKRAQFDVETHRLRELKSLVEKAEAQNLIFNLGKATRSQGQLSIEELYELARDLELDYHQTKKKRMKVRKKIKSRLIQLQLETFSRYKTIKL